MKILLYAIMAALGYLLGGVVFQKGENPEAEPVAVAGDPATSPSAAPPSSSGSATRIGLRELGKQARNEGGQAASMRAYLKLVREVPASELGGLLLRSEKQVPFGAEIAEGDVMREAIIERMAKEAPLELLQLMVSTRSLYLARSEAYRATIQKVSPGDITKAIDETARPYLKKPLAQFSCEALIKEDAEAGWRQALKYGAILDLDMFVGPKTAALAVAHVESGSGRQIGDKGITLGYTMFARENRQAAIDSIEKIARADDRLAAISGLGRSWDRVAEDLPEAVAAAEGLRSDQERLALLRGTLNMDEGTPPWMIEKRAEERLDLIITLDDGFVRDQLIEQELGSWSGKNHETAQAWAEKNGLSDKLEGITARRIRMQDSAGPSPKD